MGVAPGASSTLNAVSLSNESFEPLSATVWDDSPPPAPPPVPVPPRNPSLSAQVLGHLRRRFRRIRPGPPTPPVDNAEAHEHKTAHAPSLRLQVAVTIAMPDPSGGDDYIDENDEGPLEYAIGSFEMRWQK